MEKSSIYRKKLTIDIFKQAIHQLAKFSGLILRTETVGWT